MRILLIVDDYLPHSIKVAAKMMHELALEFISQGHKVSVLTPMSSQNQNLIIDEIEGVEVLYFKNGAIKNVPKIKRAINESLLSFNAWRALKAYATHNKFDGIVYYSPTIFFGPIVNRLKKLWGCPAYLILRDIFPQWTLDNGLMSQNSLVYKYFKIFENLNYKAADRIGVMSPSNLKYFENSKTNPQKIEVLFNWSKVPKIPTQDNTYRNKLKLNDKVVFFYGGNIGHAQQMQNLIELAKRLKNYKSAHFLFVGKGDEVKLIKKLVAQWQLENVTYLDPVDQNTYFKMLNEFDVGLFSLHPNHSTHNFPGKLLGYMGYAKPILGCVNEGNDLMNIVNEANAGLISLSGKHDTLAKNATLLLNSKNYRKQLGDNGRMLLNQKFSVEQTVTQLIDFIKQY